MNLFYKGFRSLFKLIFKLLYRHQVFGTENIPKGPAIIAPNHISYLDPPLIGASFPEEVSFLARESLFKKPVIGFLIRQLNSHPVSGSAGDLSSMKMVLKLLGQKKKVIIFPEGIRSHDGQITRVKPGICMLAIRAGAPIIPAFIHGTFEIWPRHRRFPKLRGRTFCVFGRPVYPEEFARFEKKAAQELMAAKVGQEIAKLRDRHPAALILKQK